MDESPAAPSASCGRPMAAIRPSRLSRSIRSSGPRYRRCASARGSPDGLGFPPPPRALGHASPSNPQAQLRPGLARAALGSVRGAEALGVDDRGVSLGAGRRARSELPRATDFEPRCPAPTTTISCHQVLRGSRGSSRCSSTSTGTVLYRSGDGQIQMTMLPWDPSVRHDLPIATWRGMIDRHYPEGPGLARLRDPEPAAPPEGDTRSPPSTRRSPRCWTRPTTAGDGDA